MRKLLLIPAMLLFAGCTFNQITLSNNQPKDICYNEPVWAVTPPVKKGYVYGVGIAPMNFYGEQAQRKSALSKAINEIAAQLNTTVNSQILMSMSVHNHNATRDMNSVSFQTVDGQKVSAKIIKSCKNPNNGILYILMRANAK